MTIYFLILFSENAIAGGGVGTTFCQSVSLTDLDETQVRVQISYLLVVNTSYHCSGDGVLLIFKLCRMHSRASALEYSGPSGHGWTFSVDLLQYSVFGYLLDKTSLCIFFQGGLNGLPFPSLSANLIRVTELCASEI